MTKLPPLEAIHGHGCLHCNGAIHADAWPDAWLCVGFGWAEMTRNGKEVWSEQYGWADPRHRRLIEGDPFFAKSYEADNVNGFRAISVRLCELFAARRPNSDWRMVIHGPLSGRTYQRHGPNHWPMVEQNLGFA